MAVTLNVTLTETAWSDRTARLARRARAAQKSSVGTETGAGVWTEISVPLWRSRSGMSHPGAHSGLDARMGASLDPRHGCELPDTIMT